MLNSNSILSHTSNEVFARSQVDFLSLGISWVLQKDVIEHDILIFIRYQFERIRKERGPLSNWPKVEDINSLARDANGLFIYVNDAG